MKNPATRQKHQKAFTLIELLVVIAIIALLLSIIMPALKRVKKSAKRTVCLSNVRGLTSAWLLYVQENNDRFPKSYTADDGWVRSVDGYPYNPQEAPVDLQNESLEKGLLFPYVETLDIFRCPIAKKEEFRTYSMTHALNGESFASSYGGEVLTKMSQIRNTGSRIVFLDDYLSDWDACWFVYNDQPRWWNVTPIRHGNGGNVFSFADGHTDYWAWKDQRTIDLSVMCNEADTPDARDYSESIQPGNPDLARVQTSVWGKRKY